MFINGAFCPVNDVALATRFPAEYFWLRYLELLLAKRVVDRLLREVA